MSKRKAANPSMAERADPKIRGIHPDAIQASTSPSSRAVCIYCSKLLTKGEARWGIKYAGNPLTGEGVGVIPLYGSHPMVMWCHAGCGLRYQKTTCDVTNYCDAARTCHLCSDAPDEDAGEKVKLMCGGSSKDNKIRQHAFHIKCWKNAIILSCSALDDNGATKDAIIGIDPKDICGWADLNDSEQTYVLRCWGGKK